MTLGLDAADLWHCLHDEWARCVGDAADIAQRAMDADRGTACLGPWVSSADAGHRRRLGAEVLSHRFNDIRDAAGVPTATLHRLRHSVATFLVSQGKILEAQDRLGHGDVSTTLREYSHALPGRDEVVADAIIEFLDVTQNVSADTCL